MLSADPVEVLVAVRIVRESALVEPRLDLRFERQVVALQQDLLLSIPEAYTFVDETREIQEAGKIQDMLRNCPTLPRSDMAHGGLSISKPGPARNGSAKLK